MFFQRFAGALEIGRSFIRSEYQKKYSGLFLLWRGIGEFIVRNPWYTVLFGPVSISRNYHVVSKDLIVRFLMKYRLDEQLHRHVKPRNPYRFKNTKDGGKEIVNTCARDIEDISVLISEIEKDGKGVPVLIRHYLNLNADFMGFNVDNSFSGVVDGLVMVDLCRTKEKLLKRFMGEKGASEYRRYHTST